MSEIYPSVGDQAVLTELTGVGGSLAGAKVRWWEGATIPSPNTVLADLPSSGFTGNADSSALVWGAPILDGDGEWKSVAGSKQVRQSGTGATGVVNGFLIVGDPAGTPFLVASKRYDAGRDFVETGMGDVVTPEYTLGDGSKGVVYSRLGKLKALAELVSTGKYLDGVLVRLMTNVTKPNKDTPLGSYVPATFNGYVESAPLVWGAPYIRADGEVVVEAGSVQFTAGTPTGPQVVTGYYLVGAPGGSEYLVQAFWFDTPITISLPSQGIVVDPTFALSEVDG